MMKQNKDRLFVIGLLLPLLLTLSGCRFGQRPTPTPIALPANLQTTSETADVQTLPVTRGEVIQIETYSGRVTPAREEDLFFRRSGQIAEVYVEDGDQLEAGDLIAALDNEVLEIDLESAMLGLAIAKENLAQAQDALAISRERAENNLAVTRLRLEGVSERVDADNISLGDEILENIRQLELRQAELNLESVDEEVDPVLGFTVQRAELAVERVKQSILEGQIVAPYDGEIRFIELPEDNELMAASAYRAVARLVDPSQMKIELNLTRTQLETLEEGMPVQISAVSLEGVLNGTISGLPRPFGTSQGSLTEVTLIDSEENNLLREGATVAIDVQLQSNANALVIPRSALQEENQLYYVTVLEGETLRRVNVTVGVISSDFVEILAGLDEGDDVVVTG